MKLARDQSRVDVGDGNPEPAQLAAQLYRGGADRRFGRLIGTVMWYRHAYAAGSDEDQLAAPYLELRERRARQAQRRGDFELPLRVDGGVALLQQRSVGAPAGVIYHDVDASEGAHRRLDDA